MVEEKDTAILKDAAKGSSTHHERDMEKGKKSKTKPGNPKPQQEEPAGNPRDSVTQKLQTSTTKSPRRYGIVLDSIPCICRRLS